MEQRQKGKQTADSCTKWLRISRKIGKLKLKLKYHGSQNGKKPEVEVKNKPLKYWGSPFNNQWSKMWTSSSIPKLVLIHFFTIKIQLDEQNKRKISRQKGRLKETGQTAADIGPTAESGPTAKTGPCLLYTSPSPRD